MTYTRESVVESGLCQLVKNISWEVYNNRLESSVSEILLNSGYESEEIKLAIKVNNAWFAKCRRIRERLLLMEKRAKEHNAKMFFVTFTFNDETLSKNSEESLKVYTRRFLKKYCLDYTANVDFGKLNKRIHFHAVVVCKGVLPYKEWFEDCKYGTMKAEYIRFSQKDEEKKISKYINKLSLHAIKTTTGLKRLITCRLPYRA